jgi:hypothetical protein
MWSTTTSTRLEKKPSLAPDGWQGQGQEGQGQGGGQAGGPGKRGENWGPCDSPSAQPAIEFSRAAWVRRCKHAAAAPHPAPRGRSARRGAARGAAHTPARRCRACREAPNTHSSRYCAQLLCCSLLQVMQDPATMLHTHPTHAGARMVCSYQCCDSAIHLPSPHPPAPLTARRLRWQSTGCGCGLPPHGKPCPCCPCLPPQADRCRARGARWPSGWPRRWGLQQGGEERRSIVGWSGVGWERNRWGGKHE